MLIRFYPKKLSAVLSCCGPECVRVVLQRTAVGAAVVLMVVAAYCTLYQHSYSDYLLRSLRGAIPYDDPELLEYIRHEVLIPPSLEPYNLEGKYNTALIAIDNSEYYYVNMTKELFGDMRGGVFIEAGALDGETMSNTLRLEKNFGWSGLLVEGDPVSFSKLLTKNRKAWAANCCISPHAYPSKELMSSTSHYAGPGILKAGTKMRAMHSLVSYRKGSGLNNSWYKKVLCLPLESILAAVGMKHIDLMVLDVEGAEMDILEHLNLDQYTIDVIYLEWKTTSAHKAIAEKIENRGYRLYSKYGEDLIFVRKGTRYDPGKSFVIVPRNRTLTPEQLKVADELKKRGIFVQQQR